MFDESVAPFSCRQGSGEQRWLPAGDAAKAKIYVGPTLFSDNAPSIPVTGEFRNFNGTEEMLVHIQNQILVYVSDGTKFVPK